MGVAKATRCFADYLRNNPKTSAAEIYATVMDQKSAWIDAPAAKKRKTGVDGMCLLYVRVWCLYM